MRSGLAYLVGYVGVLLVVVMVGDAVARAQGTKDPTHGTQIGSKIRSGASMNSRSDTMGGAFKGTGMPIYGTSPGMGSPKKPRP